MATLACQAPDIHVQGVKISEFLALLAVPVTFSRNAATPRVFLQFFLSIALIATWTLIVNRSRLFFEPVDVGIFRKKDIITLCRVVSFGCCLLTAVLFYRACLVWPHFPIRFLQIQAGICLLLLGFYALSWIGPHILVGPEDKRLHGLYNEGGPFGLLCAFLFCVAINLKASSFIKIVFLLCVFAAGSKAGMALVLLGPALVLAPKFSRTTRIAVAVSVITLAPLVIANIANNYVTEIADLENQVRSRLDDTNFVMGRVAGLHIIPEMVKNNPLLGVGLGNYSLVRNDPVYRGIFPSVDLWDLSGLGGIATMLAEGGLIGVILCFYPLFALFKQTSPTGRGLLVASCLSLFFGVQFYFTYPWIGVALSCVPQLGSFRHPPPPGPLSHTPPV
jgi:hypothetical protein